jgi:hypothetical protein
MPNTLTLRAIPKSEAANFEDCKRDLAMLVAFMEDPKVVTIWNNESHKELMAWCKEMKTRYNL